MNDRAGDEATTRRRLLGAAGGVVAGSAVVSGLSGGTTGGASGAASQETETESPTPTPTPPDAVWPLFQLNAFNSGYDPGGRGPSREAGASWAHVDGGSYTTTPVVTEGEVFAADEDAGVVRALDVDSGATLWETDVETSDGRMTIADRVLYVPSSDSSAELQALDPDDGSRLWSVGLEGTGKAAVVQGGSVYVATSAGVSKVSTLSNSVSWEYNGVSLRDTSIAVTGDGVFAADTQNGKVVNLSVSGGSESWTNIVGEGAVGAPTMTGSRVLVPFAEHLVALRTDSGREVWRYEQPVGSSVAVADGTVYGTGPGGDVFAVDPENGAELWRTSPLSGSNPPVVVGNLMFVAGTGGTVAALEPRDGSVVWSTDVGAEVSANPAVYGGELYLADAAGRVAGLSAGASGGYGEPTPTGTDSPTPTDSPTEPDPSTPTRSPTGAETVDGNTGGNDDDNGGGILLSPTATEEPEGVGIDLPLVGGVAAAVLAALGGALWWRNQGDDEYDPLG